MRDRFVHPDMKDVTLTAVLHALADPARRAIVRALAENRACGGAGLSCSGAAPPNLPKATMSNHFNVLRGAGLIRSERNGVEIVNVARCDELERRFPGVVRAILDAHEQ